MLLAVPLWFASCSSNPKIAGLPEKLPDIALSGSSRTPSHHMASYEYPFDSSGNYVPDWAAEGERRAGRSAAATSDDENRWTGSHGGRATGKTKTTSGTKSKTVASSSSGGSKGGSGTTKKSTTSGGSTSTKSKGPKYIVKKGDTVEKIASKLGVSAKALRAANGLSGNTVRVGAALTIPK